jgi:hypothetical protein
VLRCVFRGKFVAGLKSAFQHQQLHFAGDLAPIAQPKIFASWLRPLFRKNWVVYCKPPFGGPGCPASSILSGRVASFRNVTEEFIEKCYRTKCCSGPLDHCVG